MVIIRYRLDINTLEATDYKEQAGRKLYVRGYRSHVTARRSRVTDKKSHVIGQRLQVTCYM